MSHLREASAFLTDASAHFHEMAELCKRIAKTSSQSAGELTDAAQRIAKTLERKRR